MSSHDPPEIPRARPTEASEQQPPARVPCRECGRNIDVQDLYCRWCGARQVASDSFLYHPLTVLLLALVFIGPFALILVWRAKTMRRDVRIALTVIILAYAGVTFYFAYVFGMTVYRYFSVLFQVG